MDAGAKKEADAGQPMPQATVASAMVAMATGKMNDTLAHVTEKVAALPQRSISSGINTHGMALGRQVSKSQVDWRTFLTIEERQAVRKKIRAAYSSSCEKMSDLLHTSVAIEEELLHISAPSRLDYFKSGLEFQNRVKLKRTQLEGQLSPAGSSCGQNVAPKKQKTEA
jgi:hypothetical protein